MDTHRGAQKILVSQPLRPSLHECLSVISSTCTLSASASASAKRWWQPTLPRRARPHLHLVAAVALGTQFYSPKALQARALEQHVACAKPPYHAATMQPVIFQCGGLRLEESIPKKI